MDNGKIPLLSHIRESLARTLLLISEVAGATADALAEMQGEVQGKMGSSVYDLAGGQRQVAFQEQLQDYEEAILTGKLTTWLTDSDGNVLMADGGTGLLVERVAAWK